MKPFGSWDNYIAACRKRSGLTKAELAVLLGLDRFRTVSSFEELKEIPALPALLGLEMIFNESIQQIFAGIAEGVREGIARRARALLEGMSDKPSATTADKFRTLDELAHLND